MILYQIVQIILPPSETHFTNSRKQLQYIEQICLKLTNILKIYEFRMQTAKKQQLKQFYNHLPQDVRKLVPNPEFNPKSFQNINVKSIESLINSVKTTTILELTKPPKINFQIQKSTSQQLSAPVVLVFCQPSEQLKIDSTGNVYPYVPVAYSSWLESSGAKCIPLPYNTNQGSIQFLLERANGLLIPGGGSNLYKNYQRKEGFGPVMLGFFKIWRMINKLWQKDVYFPIWGTCLGLQIILMAITNDVKILSNLNSRAHQLEVYCDHQNSLITSEMPTQLKIQLQNRKLMNFQHAHGISVQKFVNYPKLIQKLQITGISKDKDGTWFCSMIEGKQNPIFLSQFHPQKQAFSWTMKGDIIHEKYSVLLSQYFSQSFVVECKKCKPLKRFISEKELSFYLIQQYRQIHTPQKMYKVYAIDYKYRYVDKQGRKQLKNQRSISTTTNRAIEYQKNTKDDRKLPKIDNKRRRLTILPVI